VTTGISFRSIRKTFPDGTRALDDVSFDVAPGEFVSIVGPSGCGKSILLRIASGLDSPSEGTSSLSDTNVGYVFQEATLLPWRTVRSNVALFAELRGMAVEERDASITRALELVDLDGFADKYPWQLSGGMRMRASLARSLVLRPSVFLFDEPFGALDELTRERLNDELLSIFASARFAGLFVTHSIAEAVYLSTRVLVMSPRPGSITHCFDVPFGPERSHDLRFEPEFARLCRDVSHALREPAP
jgi:NitT/TauT family transport system ATP-binding protein